MVGLPGGGRWQQMGRAADLEKELAPTGIVFIVPAPVSATTSRSPGRMATKSCDVAVPEGVLLIHGALLHSLRDIEGVKVGGLRGLPYSPCSSSKISTAPELCG